MPFLPSVAVVSCRAKFAFLLAFHRRALPTVYADVRRYALRVYLLFAVYGFLLLFRRKLIAHGSAAVRSAPPTRFIALVGRLMKTLTAHTACDSLRFLTLVVAPLILMQHRSVLVSLSLSLCRLFCKAFFAHGAFGSGFVPAALHTQSERLILVVVELRVIHRPHRFSLVRRA